MFEAAKNLFDYLRKLDKLSMKRIAVSPIPNKGIGKQLMKDYIEHHKMNEFELKKNFDFLDKSEFSFDQEIIKSHCIDWRKI